MKPIIFGAESVRAVLDGRKTQTRRVVKPQPQKVGSGIGSEYLFYRLAKGEHKRHVLEDNFPVEAVKHAPHEVGDVLYVRETWLEDSGKYYYRADFESDYLDACETLSGGYPERCRNYPGCEGCTAGPTCLKWKPSIHMPKAAARIFLRVTGVRVERLQDITLEDMGDEGFECSSDFPVYWDALNAKRNNGAYAWAWNPWVFVYDFERIEKP